jgi:hypothetical protein
MFLCCVALITVYAVFVGGESEGKCITFQSLKMFAERAQLADGQAEALWTILTEQPGSTSCEIHNHQNDGK